MFSDVSFFEPPTNFFTLFLPQGIRYVISVFRQSADELLITGCEPSIRWNFKSMAAIYEMYIKQCESKELYA
jgi:hypothetical protein